MPDRLMERLENVATPFTGEVAPSPVSVPPPGLLAIASDTVFVAVVTRLPSPSSIRTVTAGEMLAPAVAFVGWTPNISRLAAPALMSNPFEVAVVRAGLLEAERV